MRKLLSNIGQRLQLFINQSEDFALVTSSPLPDSLPLLKIIEGLEQQSACDLYWTFTDSFIDQETYVAAVITGFATKHELIRLAMEKEGMQPWPPLPPEILSEQNLPSQRLRELAIFSRELLPIPNGRNVVWIFYPLDIIDHAAFAMLMKQLLEHSFPFPWTHHLRFIIRDDPSNPAVQKHLMASPRIQWYAPDLSLDAVNRSMEEEIADEELPLAERMSTLMVVAGTDYAHNRLPQALEKYALLLQYYAPMGNYPLAALALSGMGQVYEKMGDLDRANESYETALVPASQGTNPPIPILLNLTLNLANLRSTQKRWDEAEAYYDLTQQLATANRDASLKIRSLENRGICQQQQGKLEDACKSWNDGLVIAAQIEDVELCRELLVRLLQHYSKTNQTTKECELREQLAAFAK